jgi:hypothetical protein
LDGRFSKSSKQTIKKLKKEGMVKMYGIKKIVTGIAVLVGVIFLFAPVSIAEGDTTLKLSGFVDAAYADATGSDGTFSLDQVEIDIEKRLNEKLSLRADFNYLASDTAGLTFDNIVEQGYITYALAVGNSLDLTFGKFNAPIGFELLDPVDMYQYSHALVFDNGLPTNLTGLMGSYAVSDMVDAVLYIVNGWDDNTDNNNSKTVGGRIGITPMEGVNVGVSVISGPEVDNNINDKRTVFDIDFTVTTIENLTIGGEINTGKEKNQGTATGETDSKWTGYLLMAHYDFTDIYGVTVRYDYFNDKGGARLNSGDTLKEKQKAYTIAPTFSLGEGAVMIVEYRRLESDQNVFNNDTEDSSNTIAVEFTYSF